MELWTLDPLRPPLPGDPAAAAYKDWLHVNVIDHSTGAVGLLNASLHGDPRDPRAVAVGTSLLHVPGRGWVGGVDVVAQHDAAIGFASVATRSTAVSIDPRSGTVAAAVRSSELNGALTGSPVLPATTLPAPAPFGSGWIGWSVTPRLRLTGELRTPDMCISTAGASGYQDHNWGRWYWGDDAGWDWAVLIAPEPAPVLVLSRTTNRRHYSGEWRLSISSSQRERIFRGRRVNVEAGGQHKGVLRRLPGAVAAGQTGRSQTFLPAWWRIWGGNGIDHVEVDVQATAAVQVVLAEPTRRGYNYLHEMAVTFSAKGQFEGRRLDLQGLGIVERLD